MVRQKYNLNDGHFIDWLGIFNSIPSDSKSQIKLHFSNNNSQYKAATQQEVKTVFAPVAVRQMQPPF